MTVSLLKRACVIGWPIKHSRSPLIHNSWIKEYGINGQYDKKTVKPEDAQAFMQNLKGKGYVGCSVTVPLKQIAYHAADWRDTSAKAVKAANTLWIENSKLHAMNTDTYGFMTHLSQSVPDWNNDKKPVAILGAGGAARAIIFGFLEAGVKNIRVYNRTKSRADELVQHFGTDVISCEWQDRNIAAKDCGTIVNTTTIGMNASEDPGVDFDKADKNCVVCDIVYVPLETPFLRRAKSKKLRTVDGLGMLLHQAVPGFEKWFGIRPKVTEKLRNIVLSDIEKLSC